MSQRRQIFRFRESYCLLVRREMCPKAESSGEELYRWQVSPRTLALVEPGASAVQRGVCQAAISSS